MSDMKQLVTAAMNDAWSLAERYRQFARSDSLVHAAVAQEIHEKFKRTIADTLVAIEASDARIAELEAQLAATSSPSR